MSRKTCAQMDGGRMDGWMMDGLERWKDGWGMDEYRWKNV